MTVYVEGMALEDRDVLEAIRKGSFGLKLKKLRALGFIKGQMPKLQITEDGIEEIKRSSGVNRGPRGS